MGETSVPRWGSGMVIIIAPLLMGAVLRGWGSNGATGGEGIRENAWEKWGKHFGVLRFWFGKALREGGGGRLEIGLRIGRLVPSGCRPQSFRSVEDVLHTATQRPRGR